MTDDVERPVGAGRDDEGSTPWRVVLAALKPWAAFVVALGVVDVGRGTAAFASNIIVPVAYLGFVGLPSAVPVLIAKPGWMRIAVSMAMTAVALISAVLMATTDDAQAGLAVLWVPLAAMVLTGLTFGWRILDAYLSPPSWTPTRSNDP
jgi:hypothetical protein